MSRFVVLPIAHDADDLLDQTKLPIRYIVTAVEGWSLS